MTRVGERASWVGPVAAALAWIGAASWFNRGFIFTGFQQFEGDWGDGRFIALVTSHWADPLQFPGGWKDLGIFSPYTDALSYSDTFVLYGAVAAPLQWLGVGISASLQVALIVVSAIAYASTVAFLRWGPRASWFVSIVGGLLVGFSNALALSFAHPQLLSMPLGGTVLLAALASWRARSRAATAAWSFAASALLMLIITSTFYVGWMLALGLGACGLISAVVLFLRGWRPPGRKVVPGIIGLVLGTLAIFPVFWAVYGAAVSQGTSRSLSDALGSRLRVSELFMVSDTNLVWGGLIQSAFTEIRPYEFWYAPTPILLVTVIALTGVSIFTWKSLNWWSVIGLVMGIAGLVMWLVPTEYFGWSPWQLIYAIPGAEAFRAIGRIHLLSVFLLSIALALLIAPLISRGERLRRILLSGVLLLVVFEQVNLVERQQYRDLIASSSPDIPPPPEECQSFMIMDPRWDIPGFAEQIDAMAIARETGLPTINGYSGFAPPNWNVDVDAPDYFIEARSWKGRWFLLGLCGYELANARWVSEQEVQQALTSSAQANQ